MDARIEIDNYIDNTGDWRADYLRKLRSLIHEADPAIVEAWKWDVPVFLHGSMVCAISAFKDHVKMNFFKGAALNDSLGLFNNGLDSKHQRAIDFREGEKLNEDGIKNLIREAVVLNTKK
jgi:hypothetical protein